MTRNTLGGAVMALSFVAAIGFIGVAIHEFNYASGHPYAYGPAMVIAWGGCAGAVLSVAVVILGYAVSRSVERC